MTSSFHIWKPRLCIFLGLSRRRQYDGHKSTQCENLAELGPGGESVYGDLLAFHFHDGTRNGDFRLAIRTMAWSEYGRPIVATEQPPVDWFVSGQRLFGFAIPARDHGSSA